MQRLHVLLLLLALIPIAIILDNSQGDGLTREGNGAFFRIFFGVPRAVHRTAQRAAVPETPVANNDIFDWNAPVFKIKIFGAAAVSIVLLCFLMTRIKLHEHSRALARFVGFVLLHIADYGTNVLTMYIVYITGHSKYLLFLAPIHFGIGIACLYTAYTQLQLQDWSCLPQFIVIVLVMGLMQFVQIKLALDDFREQRDSEQRAQDHGLNELAVPTMMPARFNLKTMDGAIEGTVFALVAMYALLKNHWNFEGMDFDTPQMIVLYLSAFFSFLSMGLAVMEVDFRTSAAVQRKLEPSNVHQVFHLLFRSSEVALRLLTVIVFWNLMRPLNYWRVAFVVVGVDYFMGVMILLHFGGRDRVRWAAGVLAVPLLIVNVMQFVDTPGMSLQAKRISLFIVPIRTLELIGVVVSCAMMAPDVAVPGRGGDELLWTVIWQDHTEWVIAWVVAGLLYYVLLFCYAISMKPEADLHLTIANGDVDGLRRQLCHSELVLNINRSGPDGRTPLHLAAARSKVACMRVLIEERANIHARTGDRKLNTALHLAVMHQKDNNATRYLCQLCGLDAAFLNSVNSDGETALHVASRRQNVAALKELLQYRALDIKLRNKKGETAADCAPSDKFGFDRDSSECAIGEIFRNAEAGRRPASSSAGCELPQIHSGASGGSTSSAAKAVASAGVEDVLATSSTASWPTTPRDAESPVRAAHDLETNVPLINMSENEEQEFLKRSGVPMPRRKSMIAPPVTNCGISSFMLSAGSGALSRIVLNRIGEDDDMTDASDVQQVKATIEDFTEVKAIGEGAFGKVNLVRHQHSGELFAMKLMDKAKFKAQKITSKAHSEQYILKTTRHRFIVSLQYAFQGSTFWALVMEYCPNGDLQDLLVKQGKPGLVLYECARLGGEVLLALEHLHRIQVIFRDLKLENVVLDAQLHAKLTDFGLAKKLYTSSDARTMCGSYGYAAPEIMLNTGRYTYAVDLYSYGVMMYMLLSGGETAPNNPKQRLPPMRHSSLRRRLKAEADKETRTSWALESIGALELLMALTSDMPATRTTAAVVKENRFFTEQLNHSVDDLLPEATEERPTSSTASSAAAASPKVSASGAAAFPKAVAAASPKVSASGAASPKAMSSAAAPLEVSSSAAASNHSQTPSGGI